MPDLPSLVSSGDDITTDWFNRVRALISNLYSGITEAGRIVYSNGLRSFASLTAPTVDSKLIYDVSANQPIWQSEGSGDTRLYINPTVVGPSGSKAIQLSDELIYQGEIDMLEGNSSDGVWIGNRAGIDTLRVVGHSVQGSRHDIRFYEKAISTDENDLLGNRNTFTQVGSATNVENIGGIAYKESTSQSIFFDVDDGELSISGGVGRASVPTNTIRLSDGPGTNVLLLIDNDIWLFDITDPGTIASAALTLSDRPTLNFTAGTTRPDIEIRGMSYANNKIWVIFYSYLRVILRAYSITGTYLGEQYNFVDVDNPINCFVWDNRLYYDSGGPPTKLRVTEQFASTTGFIDSNSNPIPPIAGSIWESDGTDWIEQDYLTTV